MQRNSQLIYFVKSFLTSSDFCNLVAKLGFDTAENEPFNFHNFSSLQGFDFHRAVVSLIQSVGPCVRIDIGAKIGEAPEVKVSS